MAILKQSQAYNRVFNMLSSSNNITPCTGSTLTVVISKNGVGFTSPAGTVTEIANGFYYIALTVLDTSAVGDLAYYITGTGGSPAAPNPKSFVDQISTHVVSDINMTASGRIYIVGGLQQNVGFNGFTFPMTALGSNSLTPGLSVTAQRTLAAAGFGPCANPVFELSSGFYAINLAATDTNSNTVTFFFTASGCNPTVIQVEPVP